MILCGDKTDVSAGGVRSGGGCPPPPWKDIGQQEDRAGWVKNSYELFQPHIGQFT